MASRVWCWELTVSTLAGPREGWLVSAPYAFSCSKGLDWASSRGTSAKAEARWLLEAQALKPGTVVLQGLSSHGCAVL